MHRETRVYFLRRPTNKLTQFIDRRVVDYDRVEVNGYDAPEFFVHIPFHLVYFLVRDIDIGIGRNFRMEGYDLSTGAVIVYHYVVDAHDARIIFRELVDSVYEFLIGGRAEKKVDGFLRRFKACIRWYTAIFCHKDRAKMLSYIRKYNAISYKLKHKFLKGD